MNHFYEFDHYKKRLVRFFNNADTLHKFYKHIENE
jgi:hypothetical protein